MSKEIAVSPDNFIKSTSTGMGRTPRISGKKKKGTKHSDSGYGYSHSSTADRRLNKFQEHEEAIIKDHSYSNQCYLTALILSIFLMFGLIAINIVLHRIELDPDQVIESVPFALQTTRKSLSIASENLDCSILVKRAFMHGDYQRDYLNVMAMIMCLHVTEPHSIAPDSALSAMFHLTNGRAEQLTYNIINVASSNLGVLDVKNCEFGKESNSKCFLRSMTNVLNGHVYLHGEITESDLGTQLFHSARGHYTVLYQILYAKIYNTYDGGTPKYREAKKVNNYQYGYTEQDRIEFEKMSPEFAVSPLFAKLAENKSLPPHIKMIMGKSRIRKGMPLKMKEVLARDLMENFHRARQPDKSTTLRGFLSVALAGNKSNEEITTTTYISLPKGPTLSVVSGFIVKVVHDSMLNLQFKDENTKESTMYTLIALTHRLAIDLLPESKEWTGYGSKQSLLVRTEQIVEIIRRSKISELSKILEKYSKNKKVRRTAWDRVSSFIIWENFSGDGNIIQMFSLGLPRLFGSVHYNKTRREHSRFTNGDDVSQPFMSSAGIFINQRVFMDATDDNVIFAAASSGSVRTVDAVAIPILRMLILNEAPGKAVTAPAVYYDPRKGKFLCESKSTVSHPTFADLSKRIRRALASNGIRCFSPRKDNFASMDRAGIVMSRKNLGVADIVAAVDPRSLDKNNYPVGQ